MSKSPNKYQLSDQVLIKAADTQVSCEVRGEAVILDLKEGQYYGLNDVGARIWDLIQEPKTVQQVQELLLAEYDVALEDCRRELLALLEELANRGLIEVMDEVPG